VSNSDPIRWQQRLENFERTMCRLDAACERRDYSDLEQAGLIQTFEFSFELAWNVLKDRLYSDGLDVRTPRDAIRMALAAGLLDDDAAESMLRALDKRNVMSHAYDEASAAEAVAFILDEAHPVLAALRDRLVALRDGKR